MQMEQFGLLKNRKKIILSGTMLPIKFKLYRNDLSTLLFKITVFRTIAGAIAPAVLLLKLS